MDTRSCSFMSAAMALLLCGCLPDSANYGVASIHRPVVTNGRAYVPNCPDWSSGGIDSATMTDSNFGCASATNLAAMIADPHDLVRGKEDGNAPSEVPTRSIKAWREVAPTSKLWTVMPRENDIGGQR
jgi:pilus assembly protein CpaD